MTPQSPTPKAHPVVGIRREDKNRWERRVPLAPDHVKTLVDRGVRVLVQPSSLRCFADTQYAAAGAELTEDLSAAGTILAVKEIPINKLLNDKTYVFFSHTIKAQPYNMDMLDAVLAKNIRLIDYERIVNEDNQRLVKFGRYAGVAGMLDTLPLMGNRLLAKGFSSPFMHSGFAYQYTDMQDAKDAVTKMGKEIQEIGLPRELGPLVFVFSGGDGAVGKGAREVFDLLPHEYVTGADLPALLADPSYDANKLYAVNAIPNETVRYADPAKHNEFVEEQYFLRHPQEFESIFADRLAPFTSVLVNCVYWDSQFPRLYTDAEFKAIDAQGKNRLLCLSDLSCDPYGSVEFLKDVTDSDSPVFFYDPKTDLVHKDWYKDGVMVQAVDNLPCELPTEASRHFADGLMPFMDALISSDMKKPFEKQTDLPAPLRSACITSHGQLNPDYCYIADLRETVAENQKKILILGAGSVCGPVIDYLHADPLVHLTIADVIPSAAEDKIAKRPRMKAVGLDASDENALGELIGGHDLAISLLPPPLHPIVAFHCIRRGVNMVTTSYNSPAMKELNAGAKAAGITILNEIGLDPGIDHLSAMKIIDEVQREGGEITSFVSWCGGLPAPEASDNVLGYKFSWSPRGVLVAGKNAATWRWKDEVKETKSGQLFSHARPVHLRAGYALEGLPNRDSISYAPIYGIESAKTVFRGTLRYRGFSQAMVNLAASNMFDETELASLVPGAPPIKWRDLLCTHLNCTDSTLESSLKSTIESASNAPADLTVFRELDLLDPTSVAAQRGNMLDALAGRMEEKLAYKDDERDMVFLQHIFGIKNANGKESTRKSTLIAYGDVGGYSAMAKTVGTPCAVAAKMVIDGKFARKGVHTPMTPDIYMPVLEELQMKGIAPIEQTFDVIQ